MTHEPECDDFQNDNVDGTCICPRIKDAYARGRDDAANMIEQKAANLPITSFIVHSVFRIAARLARDT